jgi:hypothetical protein
MSAMQCLVTVQLVSSKEALPPHFIPHIVDASLNGEEDSSFGFGEQQLVYSDVAGLWQLAFIAPQNAGQLLNFRQVRSLQV